MTAPLVVKLGGDALATPERIAAAARRIVLRRADRPVVAVASARRGVTDHLLGLVEQVREASGGGAPRAWAEAAADRAVTSGEVVAASLLAVALEQLGVAAAVLDAREAGVRSDGRPGHASIADIRPARVERLLRYGVVPIVTGFQGWHRGRVSALGRGGSDISAVALAVAVGAEACELVKDPGALHTADPRVVPAARPIPAASHRFVTELAEAGARVIHAAAATAAERHGLRLRFTSLRPDGGPATVIDGVHQDGGAHAVVLTPGYHRFAPANGDPVEVSTVTAVRERGAPPFQPDLAAVVAQAGATALRAAPSPSGLTFLVPARDGAIVLRAIHTALDVSASTETERKRYATQ